jgi:hypothetical protein
MQGHRNHYGIRMTGITKLTQNFRKTIDHILKVQKWPFVGLREWWAMARSFKYYENYFLTFELLVVTAIGVWCGVSKGVEAARPAGGPILKWP